MAKITQFRTVSCEIEGLWVDVGEGLRLKIARSGNSAYEAELKKLMRPHQMQLRQQTLPDSVLQNCVLLAMARTILLDWENLQDDDGNDVPYSVEKAYEYLREYKDFRDMVSSYSIDAKLFKDQELEDSKGN